MVDSSNDKNSPNKEDKLSFSSTIKNDLLGAEDWKKSKIGYLTGFSAFTRMGKSFTTNIGDSFSRTSRLWKALFSNGDELPELPADILSIDARSKFEAARRQHRSTDAVLLRTLKNTKRSTLLYFVCALLGTIYAVLSFWMWPTSGLINGAFRFCVPALLATFALRAAYTNFMFRNRALYSLSYFIKSLDWIPRSHFNAKEPR